jgi:hypothetical protein
MPRGERSCVLKGQPGQVLRGVIGADGFAQEPGLDRDAGATTVIEAGRTIR